jgi:hypothetical protein
MLADGAPEVMEHVGTCFAFGDLPPSSLRDADGTFRPIGLASLQPGRQRRRRDTQTRRRCLLQEVAHAHVHTVALDLAPMQQPSTKLNWPVELQTLAQEPDSAAIITGLQDRLGDYGDTHLSIDTRLVHSRGLVWRNGHRVPVSGTWEHTHTTIPLVGLMRACREVAAAFGRCLADPEHQQNSFLRTCVEAAGLAEPQAMLAALPPEEQADAVDALYGQVRLESGQAVIIALPLGVSPPPR